jgi:hypothetical protein
MKERDFQARMDEMRLARVARVLASDGIESLTDDDFLWLQGQIDGHYLHRFPPFSDAEDMSNVNPF